MPGKGQFFGVIRTHNAMLRVCRTWKNIHVVAPAVWKLTRHHWTVTDMESAKVRDKIMVASIDQSQEQLVMFEVFCFLFLFSFYFSIYLGPPTSWFSMWVPVALCCLKYSWEHKRYWQVSDLLFPEVRLCHQKWPNYTVYWNRYSCVMCWFIIRNITLNICFCFWHRTPKTLRISSKMRAIKVSFVLVKWLGKHPWVGTSCQENQPCD